MTVETATYINQLDSAKPGATDLKSEGDDHLRLIKSTLQATFPNLAGAVSATHTELGYVAGVTSSLQSQINAKAPLASPALTGTPTAPTAAAGTNTTQVATTAFVSATAFSAALPSQAGNAGKFVTTDGTNASWAYATPLLNVVTGTTQAAVKDNHYVLTNASATTLTLPATPSAGDVVWVTVGNGRVDNVIARNGSNIQSLAEDLTLNAAYAAVQMRYINSTIGWTFV